MTLLVSYTTSTNQRRANRTHYPKTSNLRNMKTIHYAYADVLFTPRILQPTTS